MGEGQVSGNDDDSTRHSQAPTASSLKLNDDVTGDNNQSARSSLSGYDGASKATSANDGHPNHNQSASHDANGWAQTFFSLTLISIFVGTAAVALLSFSRDTIEWEESSNTSRGESPSYRHINDVFDSFWYVSELLALLSTMLFAVLGIFFGLTAPKPRPCDEVTMQIANTIWRLLMMAGLSLLLSILSIIAGIMIFVSGDQTNPVRIVTLVAVLMVVLPGIPIYSLSRVNVDFFDDSSFLTYLRRMRGGKAFRLFWDSSPTTYTRMSDSEVV